MNVSGQTVMRELSYRNPVTLDELADSCDSAEGIDLLRSILATEGPYEQRTSVRHPVSTGWSALATRRPAFAIVGIFVVVSAVIAASVVVPGSPVGPTSAAAVALDHEAGVAAHADSVEVPVGDYLYTESIVLQFATYGYDNPGHSELPGTVVTGPSQSFSVLRPVTRQVWSAANGSGRLREVFGAPTFPTNTDRAAWIADGSPSLVPSSGTLDQAEGPGALGIADLSELSTDPASLASEIASRNFVDGPPGDAETFKIIGELLSETDASPALRSALYQVASGLEGMSLIGSVVDPLGRTGTAVAYASAGETHELIFDPRTSSLLATKDVVTNPSQASLDVPSDTVVGSTTYVISGPVASTNSVVSYG